MDLPQHISYLVSLSQKNKQIHYLLKNPLLHSEVLTNALKEEVLHQLRSNIDQAFKTIEVIKVLAHVRDDSPLDLALAYRMEAMCLTIGLHEHQKALALFNQSMEIYQTHQDEIGWALNQLTRVYALAMSGDYEQAFKDGDLGANILRKNKQWRDLATLTMNLGALHGRQGREMESLSFFDQARDAYAQLGENGLGQLAQVEINRSIALRNLGRFEESVEASEHAKDIFIDLDEKVEFARAVQNLAITMLSLGKFNKALSLLDQAQATFLTDGRHRDAILVDLFICTCLLELLRFDEVLERLDRIEPFFNDLGISFEVAQAWFYQAVAYRGQGAYKSALNSLTKADLLFEQEKNDLWKAFVQLEKATVQFRIGEFESCMETARLCRDNFKVHELPIAEIQSMFLMIRANLAISKLDEIHQLISEVEAYTHSFNIGWINYHAHFLNGHIASKNGDKMEALAFFDAAIQELEQIRGQLMVEFRASYLIDKEAVYGETVNLCLELEKPEKAFQYVERAKSRSLIDLITNQVDLNLQAISDEDSGIVKELNELREKREKLQRSWQSSIAQEYAERMVSRGVANAEDPELNDTYFEITQVENEIRDKWHMLLLQNSSYRKDASLWQIHVEEIQPYLDNETILLEFFIYENDIFVFTVTNKVIQAFQIDGSLDHIQRLLKLLQLNFNMVLDSQQDQFAKLTELANNRLFQLHELLIAPINDQIAPFSKLIIVPHGDLHYLPFHAFFDGTDYLIEKHEISYLPNASVLKYCVDLEVTTSGLLALAYTYEGRLPGTIDEAKVVVETWQETHFLEEEAQRKSVIDKAGDYSVLHIATHGEFRKDNPLFSGLIFDDGWLTTLDIFQLRLNASLVTLSGCDSGLNVIGGGDELLGLMRAFLYAGTKSLMLSLWPVEDQATATFMKLFYRYVKEGLTKGEALTKVQRSFIKGGNNLSNEENSLYQHPYFWAPFYIVGDTGPI